MVMFNHPEVWTRRTTPAPLTAVVRWSDANAGYVATKRLDGVSVDLLWKPSIPEHRRRLANTVNSEPVVVKSEPLWQIFRVSNNPRWKPPSPKHSCFPVSPVL